MSARLYHTYFDGKSQLDGVRRWDKSLPQSMEALRAEPPLAAFMCCPQGAVPGKTLVRTGMVS